MMEVTKAEFEVLEAIWQGYPCSAADIVARLENKNDWHEKTVKTLLGRLVKKHAITFEKEQRKYWYSPVVQRHEYSLAESKSLLDRLFNGRISPLVANFAEQDALQKEDVEALKKLIEDWENKRD